MIIPINSLKYDNENSIYSIILQKNIDINNHTLIIKFSSNFSNDSGLVKNISNRISYSTFFEPDNARRCFPCWDEPKYKVKYNVSIEINDLSYSVLFNSDIIKEYKKVRTH
jgi:aminopeptidase N